MGLLDGFEKLINEHGSAVILKERIALANDKYSALEQKLSASELRANQLESENQRLHLDIEKVQEKVRNLEEKLIERHGKRLDDVKEKILVTLAAQDNYENNIAQALGIGAQVATFHLEELAEMEFIYRSLSMIGETFPWRLIQNGRRYLVTHGLIA